MNSTNQPIFIICTGRSGSTLLRYILDAHDKIDAPQELHMGPMIKELIRISGLLYEEQENLAMDKQMWIQFQVNLQIDAMLQSSLKKEIWADKSVSSIDYLEEIMQVFPAARYIFLYRDCLDFVHSALEVSKYGFEGFGFEDFILKNPKNIVDGLVNFWCKQTEKRIAYQNDSSYAIFSIKYEDIVHDTLPTIKSLFDFLKLPFDPSILDNIFTDFKSGGGDLKVQSSSRINDNTGKGRLVPIKHIKQESFDRMNGLLKKIGYATVGSDFNFSSNGKVYPQAISKEINDYLSSCFIKNNVPEVIKRKHICFDIPGLENSPWRLDFVNQEIVKNYDSENNAILEIKMNTDAMLAMMHGQLNISMGYRDGLIKTNATYQELNEIGKFIFG